MKAFKGFTVLDGQAATPPSLLTPTGVSRRARTLRPASALQRKAGSSPAERQLATLQRQTDVITHDFNNLLNVILAANEALAAQLAEGSTGRELAEISQEAAEKGAALLRRLADLATPPTAAVALADAAEAAREAARLARLSAPAAMSVDLLANGDHLACRVDRADLGAALLNLCVNAGHAMPDGGALRIETAPVDLDDAAARALDLAPGAYVRIAVTDTGVGMSPDTLARCVEPYFTTRRGRGGTGLGLAGVQDFAARCGGRLVMASTLGHGTTATLYLPGA